MAKKGYTVFAGVRKEADKKALAGLGISTIRPIILDVTKVYIGFYLQDSSILR